jgi:hypothetical protein
MKPFDLYRYMRYNSVTCEGAMKTRLCQLARRNVKLAKEKWPGNLSKNHIQALRALTQNYGFAVALDDVLLLDGKWYVTHAGLLRLATRRRCHGIRVQELQGFCDPAAGRWIFRAIVYKTRGSKGFVGHGDADPSNVSLLAHGVELRVAETRAVNRALRKAYGIGLCSAEELGSFSSNSSRPSNHQESSRESRNGANNGQPRLRDQLCLLIRQHNLDPTLVKAYAADFCGTPSLKEASRELVQSFISHLIACAKENRDMLVCRLNSYAQPPEAKP